MSKEFISYFLFALISFILQLNVFIYFTKTKSPYKKLLMHCIALSICLIPIYFSFIMTRNINLAKILKSLYYIITDIIVYFMLNFSQVYIYYFKQTFRRRMNIITWISIVLDVIYNVVNYFTPIVFNLTLMESNSNFFWHVDFYIFGYVHLFFVYALLASSFINFLYGYLKNPDQYKTRYLGIMIAYFLIIFINSLSFAIKIRYDISFFMFGYLIEFIYYFSTFIIPHHLLIQSLKSLNSTVNDGIIYFDNNGKVVYMNNSAKDTFIENEVFTYESLAEFRNEKLNQLQDELDNVKLTWNEDFNIFNEIRHMYFEHEDVICDNIKIGSYFLISDITDDVNKYEKEKYINTHDSLTNLYNEDKFYVQANELIEKNPETPRYMITTNIRDFKLVNELFGQEFGNKVLKREAEILKKVFGQNNSIFARLNDDKFVVLIEKAHFHEQMFVSIEEQLRGLFDNNYTQLHLFVGVCEVNANEDAKVLVDKTKIAIEMGKDKYHQTFFYYDSLVMEKILAEKNIINEFKNAIIYNQIQINLQPIVDTDGKIKGAEALSRWYNPIRGLMYPNKFIPILENNSIIHNLDLYLWDEIAKLISEWKNKNGEVPFVSVNISDKDVYYIDLYTVFTNLVRTYNIPPEKIILEFKENSIVSNVSRISQLFTDLREFGFKIAIDNYGHGYSSLNFLKDIQIDILKIDMVFLSENEAFERSKLILNFLAKMAKELEIELVFEGVETLDQYKLINQFGNVLIQGYYFSNPISIEDFEKKMS